MNEKETSLLLTSIQGIWRTQSTAADTVRIWQRALSDIPFEAAETALDAYVRGVSDDFPPKPADIRRMIGNAVLALPTEDEAWRMCVAEVNRVGIRQSVFHDGERYILEPTFPVVEVALAAEATGWHRICGGVKDAFVQKDFKAAYGRYCEQTRTKALLSDQFNVAEYRAGMAKSLRNVVFGTPKTLYDLGCPAWYAGMVDGSGPEAGKPLPAPPDRPDEQEQERPVPPVNPAYAGALNGALNKIAVASRMEGRPAGILARLPKTTS